MSVPLNSNDKCVVYVVGTIVAGIAALGSTIAVTSNIEFGPPPVHYLIPPEAAKDAAQYSLSLKMAGSAVSSSVDYARKIFGVCCNCALPEQHETEDYVERAMQMLEEEGAVEAVANMFSDDELDHTTYVGMASFLEGERTLPGELMSENWVDVPLPPAIPCSNPCCQE